MPVPFNLFLMAGNKGFGDAYTFDTAYYTALLNKPWTNTKVVWVWLGGILSSLASAA